MNKSKRIIWQITGVTALIWLIIIILYANNVISNIVLLLPWIITIGLVVLAVINLIEAMRKYNTFKTKAGKEGGSIGIFIAFIWTFWAFCTLLGLLIFTAASYFH